MDKKTINCACRHIAVFRNQSIKKETADFGKPCVGCEEANECNYDWLNKMMPLFDKSDIKISMVSTGEGEMPIER